MKKNTILLSTLLLSLSLVSCNKEENNKEEKPVEPTKEEIYTTFKNSVMNEFAYKDSKTLKIDAAIKAHSVHISGLEAPNNNEIALKDFKPIDMNIVKNSSYDKQNNTFVKSSIDPTTNEAKLEEFYYKENDKEYRCYMDKEFDFDSFDYIDVKKRDIIDNGHMDTVTSMKPAKQIEVLTGAKTFDELLENATNMMGDFSKLIKDFKVNNAAVETKDTETGHEAKLTTSLSGDILGTMKFDANLEGVLKYTDERIESFVVTGNGSIVTSKKVNEKDIIFKQDVNINANILLSREATTLVPASLINEYKAIPTTSASKEAITATSVLGNSKLTIGEVGSDLPLDIKNLKHCDVKVYKDDSKKEEVLLETLEQKTYKQSVYIDIVPQQGYSLIVETQKDPSGFGMDTVKHLELNNNDKAKYEYLKNVNLNDDWGSVNGKEWTNVYLDGEKVSDTTNGLVLESGKIYKVEYEYIEPTVA